MKKVMILAGGNDQIALMEEIRRYFKNEVEIILVDMSEKVRAIPYADKFLKISTMDKAAVLKAAREEKIDYILTACGDQPLSTMAYVATEMGLPTYLTEHDVRDLTNKRYMKEKMVQVGIPTAKHIYINKTWDGKLPDWESFLPDQALESLEKVFRFHRLAQMRIQSGLHAPLYIFVKGVGCQRDDGNRSGICLAG